MIPWIESHTYQIGPLTLQTWGTFVGAAFFVATWIAVQRAHRLGLQAQVVWDMAVWICIAAMLGSRLFHVVLYNPGYYLQHPLEAVDPRLPGFAIMGGILCGAAAAWYVAKKKGLDVIAYADALAWGVPWGCGIGRIGCFLIHDHPGTLTSFVGGVKYPDGQVRHDLGLYLSVLGFGIGLLFLLLNRKKRSPGFWIAAFFILDGVARFALDFLRIADRRIFYLTPTQWMLIGTVGVAVWFTRWKRVLS